MQLYRCGTLPVFVRSIKRNAAMDAIDAVEMTASRRFPNNKILNLIREIIKLVVVMNAVDWWKSRQARFMSAR
jgi:hypothetical protein